MENEYVKLSALQNEVKDLKENVHSNKDALEIEKSQKANQELRDGLDSLVADVGRKLDAFEKSTTDGRLIIKIHYLRDDLENIKSKLHPELTAQQERQKEISKERGDQIDADLKEAGDPKTKPERLLQLVDNSDRDVRFKAIEKISTLLLLPSTPAKTLEILAKGTGDKKFNEIIYYHLAQNKNTPPKILENLAKSKDEDIVLAVASNSSTPSKTLDQLANSNNRQILIRIAANPSTSLEAIKQLSKNQVPITEAWINDSLKELVKNPQTSGEVLIFLSTHKNKEIRDKAIARITDLAHDPKTKPDILKTLSKSPETMVRRAVAQNPSTNLADLIELSNDKETIVSDTAKDLTSKMLTNGKLNEQMMQTLSKSPVDMIRHYIALHAADPTTLSTLARDDVKDIRKSVTLNPKTSASTLVHLSSDSNEDVKEQASKRCQELAKDDKSSEQTLSLLADSSDRQTKMLVVAHKNTSITAILKLAKDSNEDVSKAAYKKAVETAQNKKISTYILNALSECSYPEVKKEVIRNPKTTPDILAKLQKDKDKNVSDLAYQKILEIAKSKS